MIFVWIALYGLILSLSKSPIVSPWVTSLTMILYVLILIFLIFQTGQNQSIGLRAMNFRQAYENLFFFPLCVIPLYNILHGTANSIDIAQSLFIAGVSVVEELYFRGFLLNLLSKRSKFNGILLSSGVFALFHAVNLFSSLDLPYTLMQILVAFVVGVCYSAVSVKSGSLIPCMIAHCLTNVTGLKCESIGIGLWICLVIHVWYAIWLCRRLDK